ncbi:MAG: ABC transporter permease [Armatimonadota bacterium]
MKPGTTKRALSPITALALAYLLGVLSVAVLSNAIMPTSYTATNLEHRLEPPALLGGVPEHPLGTDQLGRDMLSRLIRATRTSLLIAFFGSVITLVLGTTLGILAAHFRGWVDETVSLLVDFQYAVPFMILALMVIAFFGANMTLFVVLLGIQGWMRYARLTRALSLSAQEHGYAVAGRALGMHPVRLYALHIIPNSVNVLIVQFTLNFPAKVLVETSLSFLGLGVQPPEASLGSMLAAGRDYLLVAPWIALLPGMTIFFTTLSMSIVGDWLQDRWDTTTRGDG